MADWTDEVLARSFDAAKQRGAAVQRAPHAKSARYDRRRGRIVVELDNGCAFAFPARLVQGLAAATADQLAEIELLGDGYALHWPRINADIRIEGALAGIYGSPAWMAKLAAQAASRSPSPRKATAARAKGAKGGRPKRVA
ncbi:MAG: DUF2442 domain-containing protein [Rhodocyclaceae bacterium]|nr:DUF2442 domain-containing protein [Rhodocyclaceae bacterium]